MIATAFDLARSVSETVPSHVTIKLISTSNNKGFIEAEWNDGVLMARHQFYRGMDLDLLREVRDILTHELG